jgi:predicted lipid-binding transport protein (Tim44 family)
MMNLRTRRSKAMVVLATALTLAAGVAEARVGGGRGSFGSRGARTYEAPPMTRTAPNPASPIERSQAPQPGPSYQRPGMAPSAAAAQPRRFGFGTGLMAGLFGAGLLGLLTGHGFFGGLAGLASVFGLLLQIGLIVLLVSLAMRWFRRRQEPAYAGASPSYARSGLGGAVPPVGGGVGHAAAASASRAARPPASRDEVGIGEADYAAFERSLVEMQSAYSRQDVAALWTVATAEMAGYIQEELNDNARKGVVNTVSDVRLLQGDLAEAWREGDADYATVAMRYGLIDVTRDKATGRIVEGDPVRPTEATELWTFRRDRGGDWKLSAIQQA